MTPATTPTAATPPGDTAWKRNLFVCSLGSFTTIVAMTLLLPFLPLYVADLGARTPAEVAWWSGIAYGATFFTAALTAPLWGRLSDRYGRKLMLIRASLGMAVAMSLIGMAQSVWQLVALRLLAGLLGGYASGSTVLVAAQTPKEWSGWALGVLSAAIMAGNLAGPLIGGLLPQLVGIRITFFLAGGVIFMAFLGTVFFLEERKKAPGQRKDAAARPAGLLRNLPLVCMLATGFLLMFANMSIEPIVTLYVAELVPARQVTLMAGFAMSAAALGSMLSSARLGGIADRIGHWSVVILCLGAAAALLVPQAFVTAGWQFVALRFAMGLALGGLLPCIVSVIRHGVPDNAIGAALGYSISAQYAGQVLGPMLGGALGGHAGMRSVFFVTSGILAAGAAGNLAVRRAAGRAAPWSNPGP